MEELFYFRHLTNKLIAALSVNPVTFINGPRQAGKSSLVQDLADHIGKDGEPAGYLTFDRPTTMASASAAPEAFLKAYKLPVIMMKCNWYQNYSAH